MEIKKAHEIFGMARSEDLLLSLYSNSDFSKFVVGFVEAWSNDHVILRAVEPGGDYGGFLIRSLGGLSRIDCHNRYLEKLSSLYSAKKVVHSKPFLPGEISFDLLTHFLRGAQELDFAVRINTHDDDETEGFVREVGLTTLTLDVFSEYGDADGVCVIDLEEINKAMADSRQLRDLKLLARWSDQAPPL